MNTEAVKLKVIEWLVEESLRQPEYFLVDIKVQGKKISVFLDGDKGITIDKCAEFSRFLQRHLEGERIASNYILEVSSPGMDNPFKAARQYKNAIGKEVSVIKFDGIRVDGVLKEADENKVLLETNTVSKGKPMETKTCEIPLTEIKSTKLKINF